MKYLLIALTLSIPCILNSQISSVDLYTSNARTDQRNYGNGVTKLLIDGDNLMRQGRWEGTRLMGWRGARWAVGWRVW